MRPLYEVKVLPGAEDEDMNKPLLIAPTAEGTDENDDSYYILNDHYSFQGIEEHLLILLRNNLLNRIEIRYEGALIYVHEFVWHEDNETLWDCILEDIEYEIAKKERVNGSKTDDMRP